MKNREDDKTYPEYDDLDFQTNIFKKREYYIHKVPYREKLVNYQDIKRVRDQECGSQTKTLHSQQLLVSNFINPETPFKGLLLFHSVGTGKCVFGDTEVIVNDEKIKISELWNKHQTNVVIEEGEWTKPDTPLFTNSFDQNNKITSKEIKYLYRERFIGELRKIRLYNEIELICSVNHMLLTDNGFTNSLEIGDFVYTYIEEKIKLVRISDIEIYPYDGWIYDLEVDHYHNYIANGIITHNTCCAFTIAENFKQMVKKYNTKIYILIGGPLLREQWKNELITVCARNTYLKDFSSIYDFLDETEKSKILRLAKENIAQYYRIMSYRSFQKKVLGQKIIDRKPDSKKKLFKKTQEGEYERDVSIDKLESLNNTLLIIDEAHSLTGNEYGMAVKKIIDNSKNLKIILLTATPMKNLGDDIIELLNFLRPKTDQIIRDKIFINSGHLLELKPDGLEYFKQMANGYVSHFRGGNPTLYAEPIEAGEIPSELIFTNLTRCIMDKFQLDVYNNVIKLTDDALDRRSQAVANFVFPGLNKETSNLDGYYGEEGMQSIINILKINKQVLVSKLNEVLYDNKYKNPNELVGYNDHRKIITGKILHIDNLRLFSVKFHTALVNLERLIESDKGCGTSFIYSNLVKVGINLFQEILLENGYLEFNEDFNYNIRDNTRDYRTGLSYKDYVQQFDSDSFKPATFLTITGQTDDVLDDTAEKKIKIKDRYFNNTENRDGKLIKFILGSRVMNEGITLKNVKQIHILDVHWNLGRVYQVIGRAIRRCVHYSLMNEENPFPTVEIFKYVISLPDKTLSTEEDLYRKAELKFILIKDMERALKEVSIDCPLNYNGNIFPEEVDKYKGCVRPLDYIKLSERNKKKMIQCPVSCDFQNCKYMCFDKKLNLAYYDNTTQLYKKLSKDKIDYSTFTTVLKKNEVNEIKQKIKLLYRYKYVYELEELINLIRNSYIDEKRELFDEFFVFKALDELIPMDENDFNNFVDIVYDKYSIPGYLIYIDKYYVFQPFNQNEDVPMWYRSTFITELRNDISLYDYLKSNKKFSKIAKLDTYQEVVKYDFDSVLSYYSNKEDFVFIGIIDRPKISKSTEQTSIDVFKLRPRQGKTVGQKKRGIGIFSLKGSVCETSRDKNLLIRIANTIGVTNLDKYKKTRTDICNIIRARLLYLEKYTTDKNKLTFMIIPSNHAIYTFPLNLEDRIDHIINEFKNNLTSNQELNYNVKKSDNGIFEGIRHKSLPKYILEIKNTDPELESLFKKYKFENKKLIIE